MSVNSDYKRNNDLETQLGLQLIEAVKIGSAQKIQDVYNRTSSNLGIYQINATLEACKRNRLDLAVLVDTHGDPSITPEFYGLHLLRLERQLKKENRGQEFREALSPVLNQNPRAGGNDALQVAVAVGHLLAVQHLVANNNLDPKDCNEALRMAAERNLSNMIPLLLQTRNIELRTFNRAILRLIANENIELIRNLMLNRELSLQERGDFLLQAVESGNIDLVLFFLNNGPIAESAWDQALQIARENGNPEISALFTPIRKYSRIFLQFLSTTINAVAAPLGEFGAEQLDRFAHFWGERSLFARMI